MTIRKYTSRSQQTTLTAGITSTATSLTVVSASALLGGVTINSGETFTIVIDPDTALEEIVDVYSASGNPVSGNVLTIVRGIDGSSGQVHSAGAAVRHMAIGRDFREANTHENATSGVHGVTGSVVGTTDTQTLSNKSISGATNTLTAIPNSATTATSANTASTIVARDASGNFSAGTVTANLTGTVTGNITGNAATATALQNARDFQILGDVEASAVSFNGTGNVNLTTQIATGVIVNADVNTSAQIAYGKLNLANSIVNADINASAAIDKTKISGTAITAADTGTVTSAMIANGAIVDADINAAAAITFSKLAAPVSDFSVNSQKITNLATPTAGTDAATKAYADLMIPLTQKAAANGVASLDAGGKVPTSQLPDVAITNTFVVASQAAMLALTAQTGDVAVRTDLNKSFILTAEPASTLGNWQELLTPTDSVLSVDGRTGAVTLSDLYDPLGSAATKLPLAGGTMTGAIAMGTNKITGLGDPTNAQDAATKNYIDTAVLAPSNLTGVITSVGNVTSTGAQTGTGNTFVMDTSPTLVTPNIGVATATSVNGTTIPSSETLVTTTSTAYIVPSQTGNSGKYLTTDGSVSSWAAVDLTSYATLTGTETLTNKTLTAPVINLGTNAQTGTTYTLALTDNGKLVEVSNASAITVTVPANSSVAFPVGAQVNLLQTGAGQITVAGAGGVTVNATPGLKLREQWSSATLIKRATDTWVLVGDLSA